LWTPYQQPQISGLIIIDVSIVMRAVVPVICFATFKFHQADRVMRQFEYQQHTSHDPCNLNELHKEDMCEKTNKYWPHYQQCGMTDKTI